MIKRISFLLLAAALLFSCEKTDIPQPKPIVQPDDQGQGGGEVKKSAHLCILLDSIVLAIVNGTMIPLAHWE